MKIKNNSIILIEYLKKHTKLIKIIKNLLKKLKKGLNLIRELITIFTKI